MNKRDTRLLQLFLIPLFPFLLSVSSSVFLLSLIIFASGFSLPSLMLSTRLLISSSVVLSPSFLLPSPSILISLLRSCVSFFLQAPLPTRNNFHKCVCCVMTHVQGRRWLYMASGSLRWLHLTDAPITIISKVHPYRLCLQVWTSRRSGAMFLANEMNTK